MQVSNTSKLGNRTFHFFSLQLCYRNPIDINGGFLFDSLPCTFSSNVAQEHSLNYHSFSNFLLLLHHPITWGSLSLSICNFEKICPLALYREMLDRLVHFHGRSLSVNWACFIPLPVLEVQDCKIEVDKNWMPFMKGHNTLLQIQIYLFRRSINSLGHAESMFAIYEFILFYSKFPFTLCCQGFQILRAKI